MTLISSEGEFTFLAFSSCSLTGRHHHRAESALCISAGVRAHAFSSFVNTVSPMVFFFPWLLEKCINMELSSQAHLIYMNL